MKLLLVIFGLLSTVSYGQDAREIVNRYLDTVSNGNIDNWNKIKSLYRESEGLYSQQNYEHKIDFLKKDKPNFTKEFLVFPYNHKHELYEDSVFTKLSSTFNFLEKRTIILMGNMPPVIKHTSPRDESISDHLPIQIWKLMNKSKSVKLLGIKEFPNDGFSCYEIKIHTKGRNYYLYINTKTFLLEYWNGNEEEDRSFLTKYYNYKKVEDFLMPMSNSAMRNGVVYYWNNIRKIEINADIDLEVFNYKD